MTHFRGPKGPKNQHNEEKKMHSVNQHQKILELLFGQFFPTSTFFYRAPHPYQFQQERGEQSIHFLHRSGGGNTIVCATTL